jgi:hypothetical protein
MKPPLKIVLAVYLILCGIFWLTPAFAFPAQGVITGLLAIIAAILLLVDLPKAAS